MRPPTKTFDAPSPKDSELRTWEALEQLGTDDPHAFVTADSGDHEEYKPGSEGYNLLLKEYRKNYPED